MPADNRERQYTKAELLSMREILQIAIEREEQSFAFYREARDRSSTRAEREMFEKLMDQEREHKRILVEQLEALEAQMDIDRALSEDFF